MQPAFASCLVYINFIVAQYVPTKLFSVVSEIIVLWITGVLPTKKQQFLDHAHMLFKYYYTSHLPQMQVPKASSVAYKFQFFCGYVMNYRLA
jgi:hypothetical protein